MVPVSLWMFAQRVRRNGSLDTTLLHLDTPPRACVELLPGCCLLVTRRLCRCCCLLSIESREVMWLDGSVDRTSEPLSEESSNQRSSNRRSNRHSSSTPSSDLTHSHSINHRCGAMVGPLLFQLSMLLISAQAFRLPSSSRALHASASAPEPAATSPLCLLHLAYDGTRYRGWRDNEDDDDDGQQRQASPLRRRPALKRTPTLCRTLLEALSVIHGRAPPRTLGLEAAVPTAVGVSARGAQLAFYRPPPPQQGEEPGEKRRHQQEDGRASQLQGLRSPYPFDGDWARATHSLNRILPEDLRVLSVQPAPWTGFDPRRDLASGRFVYTVLLGAAADPTLRHHGWILSCCGCCDNAGCNVAAGAKQIEAAANPALAGENEAGGAPAPPLLTSVRVTAARGPGIGAARARMYTIRMEAREPGKVDQTGLVAWLGGVVRLALVCECCNGGQDLPQPPLAALVLEELVFRENGGVGPREWVLRDSDHVTVP